MEAYRDDLTWRRLPSYCAYAEFKYPVSQKLEAAWASERTRYSLPSKWCDQMMSKHCQHWGAVIWMAWWGLLLAEFGVLVWMQRGWRLGGRRRKDLSFIICLLIEGTGSSSFHATAQLMSFSGFPGPLAQRSWCNQVLHSLSSPPIPDPTHPHPTSAPFVWARHTGLPQSLLPPASVRAVSFA